MEDGMTLDELFEYTNIDPWFLNQLAELHQAEQWLSTKALDVISREDMIQAKKRGFSDIQISRCTGKQHARIYCLPSLKFSLSIASQSCKLFLVGEVSFCAAMPLIIQVLHNPFLSYGYLALRGTPI